MPRLTSVEAAEGLLPEDGSNALAGPSLDRRNASQVTVPPAKTSRSRQSANLERRRAHRVRSRTQHSLNCPFHVRYPGSCIYNKFSNIARMNEHIKRAHAPLEDCPECHEAIQSIDILQPHSSSNPLCGSHEKVQPHKYRVTKEHLRQIAELPRDPDVQRKWEVIYQILFPASDLSTQPQSKVPSSDNFQESSHAMDTKPLYSYALDFFDFENTAGDVNSLDHENLADDVKDLVFNPVSEHSTGQNLSQNVELFSPNYAFQQPLIQETVVDSGYGTISSVSKDRYHNGASLHNSMENSTNLPESASFRRENAAYCDDMDTVYTDRNMVDDITADSHILRLAQDLFEQIKADSLTDSVVEAVTIKMPELLQAFAVNLGYQSPTQMHRDVMAFIHMNRNAIAESFKAICRQPDLVEDTAPQTRDTNPYSLDRWLGSSEDLEYDYFEEEPQDYEDSPNDEGTGYYDKFISSENSYQWLIDRLRRETLSSNAASDTLSEIRDRIMQAIPRSNYVSRRENTKGATVTFKLDWNLFGFLAGQNYAQTEPLAETIANVVTLTGSGTDAQALGCSDYLSQTWPSTGPHTILLIQKLLRSKNSASKVVVERPSQLILQASIETKIVTVEVSGSPYFVAEIGEQLAWMSAALRPSLGDQKAVYYTHQPYVDSILPNPSGDLSFDCSIKCRAESLDFASLTHTGQCWHRMFNQPVVVQGFPVLRRPEKSTGLELPLNMMTALVRSTFINVFNGNVFIKGFSMMLVPTKRSADLLVWHCICTEHPGSYISYLDCNVDHADVSLLDLEKYRHVVGWCADAVCNIGTLAANYSIGKSILPNAHAGCALEKVEISAGQIVTGTACFRLGDREKAVHISKNGYLAKLRWISSKYFLFWDEQEKQGWLANGASTLLHLLRAYLVQSKREFPSDFLTSPHDLPDAVDPTRPEAAMEVLASLKNRELRLYVEKSNVYDDETTVGPTSAVVPRRHVTYYTLGDRVEHIFNCLEKLIAHQADVQRRSGININIQPRRQLEGWDFKDLVTDKDPFLSRVATLPTIGKGWVDLTRSLNAVTLFGRGFGELIQPKAATITCPLWTSLPSNKFYLACCMADLIKIMEDGDNLDYADSNPRRLSSSVLWSMKESTFLQGACQQGRRHWDPVQVLFPLTFISNLKKKVHVELQERGAVIFGQSVTVHWHWKDTGDPVKGDPPSDLEATGSLPGGNESCPSTSSSTEAFDVQETATTLAHSRSDVTPASTPPSAGADPSSSYAHSGVRDRISTSAKRHLSTAMSSATKRMKR